MQEFKYSTIFLKRVNDIKNGAVLETDHLRYLLLILGVYLVRIDYIDFEVWDDLPILLKINISNNMLRLLLYKHMMLPMVLP